MPLRYSAFVREGDDISSGADEAKSSAEAMAASDATASTERRRIRAATILFSAATALSRVAGLLREIVTSAIIGATSTYSAFVIANQIPNLLRSLVADSALSGAFVPVFSELRENGERERAWRVAGAVCGVIIAVLGPLTVIAMVAAPWIVEPFVDTFSQSNVDLTVGLTRLLLPIVLILALSGVVVGILNTHDRFGAAALAPVAWNAVILISLVCAYVFYAEGDTARIWLLAIGTLVGTVVQAVLPVPWLRGLGGHLSLRSSWRDPKVREVFVLMLPITISLGLINVQQFIGTLLAAGVDASDLVAGLDPGAGPALLDKAFRIYMLPQGIFSVAVSTVVFPVLARMAARGDRRGFADTVDAGLRQILMLLVPSSVFIGVFAEPITRALYERGQFDAAQTEGVALALLAFAIGLTFNGLSLLLVRSLFSLRATWLPGIVSAVTLAVNLAVLLALREPLGVFGIALATSVANLIGVVLLYRMLASRTDPLGTARTVVVGVGTLVAAVVGVGIAFVGWLGWREWLGTGPWVAVLGLAAALAVAAPIYLWVGARFGVVRPGLIGSLLRRGKDSPA
ncbi:MAG: integral rane protein MviN [Thermoleophilia bacterium]|nr:integral rane protein MviN [Thermoleophilia bacterium]